jgi:TolB-like protein/Flp pilus assembly protein TadD
MTEPSRGVFLSYASQDAQAAQRICDALRAAGIEVWFDKSELRGGEVWDSQIRRQIHDCALLIPIISTNTQARPEGYFRLEWKLAVERTHLMSQRLAFLVPVVIDDTLDAAADVPDKFREVQWTRLPDSAALAAFVDRVRRLLQPSGGLRDELGGKSSIPTAARAAPRTKKWFAALLIGVALAALASGYFLRHQGVPARPAASQAALPAPAAPDKSVAVLPFADMSEKKDQEYFSDGLSEELIDMLSKVPDLHVPARTSSFYFKGKNEKIAVIAHELGVAHVLEGSVRKAGDRLRVSAQLIGADSGYHLWSETYDRDAKDIFKVQDEIAAAVVAALKAKLSPSQKVSSRRTSSTEGYNEFLLGRQFYNRRNLDDWRRAIGAYQKAIAFDPHYGAAYAGLALSESFLGDTTGDAALLKRAETHAEKAIELAPEEADGYVVRGFWRAHFGWDWTGAQADFERALLLEPTSEEVQHNYAILLMMLGRISEALPAYRRATELDPLSNPAWDGLGNALASDRNYPAAGDALRRALEIQPDSGFSLSSLAMLQLLEGKATEALATAPKIDFEPFRLQIITMAEFSLGHATESQQAIDELIAKHTKETAFQIAEAYAWRGEKDKAFEWLERAYRQRDGGLSSIKLDPPFDRLRQDPRYQSLLHKINLPE